RRRHTRSKRDWSSDVCSSDLRKSMRLQKNSSERVMNLEARYLIVPPSLETAAEQIVAQITPTESKNVNPFSGKLQIIVEPRLERSEERRVGKESRSSRWREGM